MKGQHLGDVLAQTCAAFGEVVALLTHVVGVLTGLPASRLE